MEKILTVKNLKKYYTLEKIFSEGKEKIKALDGISFEVKKKQIFAVVGESGSGKTTLGRCITGLEIPDEGEIMFEGEKLKFDTKEKRRKIQYIFQDTYNSLNPRMKIFDIFYEIMKFHFKMKKEEIKIKTIELLKKVGLNENIVKKYPHELSGGQRQRIVIARALSMKPIFIVADEPISNLDVSVQSQILQLFYDLNQFENITILFITHDLRILKNFADYIIVMKDGKIVEEGRTEKIYKNPENNYTKKLLISIPGSPYKWKLKEV